MVFSFLRKRRRRKLLSEPFPEPWLEWLRRNVRHYALLAPEEQSKLRDTLRIFIAEKSWEGCGGQEITDEVRVTIAAHAALLALGFDDFCFEPVLSVLVYPGGYLVPGGGRVERRFGEAEDAGAAVVSWWPSDERGAGQARVAQVVFHELAHLLDMMTGEADGQPPIADAGERRRWREVIDEEYERYVEEDEGSAGSVLSAYGAESVDEFFAVATECLFQQPVRLREERPELYRLLAGWYRQDPALRIERAGGAGADEPPAGDVDTIEREELDEAIRRHPDYAEGYRERAALLVEQGELRKAVRDLDQVLRILPDDADAYQERGECWLDLDRPEKAAADFDRALRLAPGSIDAHLGRAEAYLALEEPARALAECDAALRVDPGIAAAYALRASARDALGERGKAAEDRARAWELGWEEE